MATQALVLSHDQDVLRTVRRVLNDLGMRVEVCTGAERAAEWVERRKFDVAVVDIDGSPGAAAVLNGVRQSAANRNTVAFAILGGVTTPKQAFDMGASLTLEKPLSMDRAVRSFRAANVLVVATQRHFHRHKVEMPVTVMIGNAEIQATATDISEGGLAVRVLKPLPVGTPLQVRFKLPGSQTWITSSGNTAWSDEEGRAGIRYESFPASAREEFERWISENGKPEGAA